MLFVAKATIQSILSAEPEGFDALRKTRGCSARYAPAACAVADILSATERLALAQHLYKLILT
jgi:hypothetical protein